MKQILKAPISCFLLLLVMCSLLLTGCADLVEIQDRDFVMALGISYSDGQYRISYSLPDLGATTDQADQSDKSSLLRIYEGRSLPEIEQYYNSNSENRLDYRHLQVIILDRSVCVDEIAMKNLLMQLRDNYDISHSVLVYYYASDLHELMGMDSAYGSIGEHLLKLNRNNHINGIEPTKLGTLVDNIVNERTLLIPALEVRDNSVAVNGAIFFRDNHVLRQISQTNSDFYFMALGKNNDYLIWPSPDHLVQIKEVNAKSHYQVTDQGPAIELKITGTAKPLPDNVGYQYPEDALSEYIKQKIVRDLDTFMKHDKIDYLNLYEKSSYKHRQMWLRYENRLGNFIDEVAVSVTVDVSYE